MLGIGLDSFLTISCNEKIYKINLETMKADTFDLEGNPVSFCDSIVEFDTLMDRIYTAFRYGLKENLPYELKSEI